MLSDKLRNDLNSALKNKEAEKVSTLRLLLSALSYEKIDKQHELSEEEVISVLKKEAKKRQESIDLYKQGGRENLAEKEAWEMALIKSYLPEEMSEEQVRSEVATVLSSISEEDKLNFGKVMQQVMAKLKGKADGSVISKIAKELLSTK